MLKSLLFLFVCALSAAVSEAQSITFGKIENGNLILKPGNTVPLPQYLEIGKTYRFVGERKGLCMRLKIKKQNYTDIKYHLSIVFPNGEKIREKGMVSLNRGFFMGTEERQMLSSGVNFSCNNYLLERQKGKSMQICIGQISDDLAKNKDQIVIQITRSAATETTIDLDNTPELIRQQN